MRIFYADDNYCISKDGESLNIAIFTDNSTRIDNVIVPDAAQIEIELRSNTTIECERNKNGIMDCNLPPAHVTHDKI